MAKSDGSDLLPEKRQRLLELQSALRDAYPHGLPTDVLLFRCTHCEGVYPLNHYSRNDQRRYGIRSICRQCRRLTRPDAHYLPDPLLTEKWCSSCSTTKPVSAFAGSRHQPDGYTKWCRECEHNRKAVRVAARTLDEVLAYRHEQTIRLCGAHQMDHPGYDIKYCGHCQTVKSIDGFPMDTTRLDWRKSICKTCRVKKSL